MSVQEDHPGVLGVDGDGDRLAGGTPLRLADVSDLRMLVSIPPGARPGSQLQAQSPSGTTIVFTVPQGATVGTLVRVEVPQQTQKQSVVKVVVPEGVKEGDSITAVAPDGVSFKCKVPPGVSPGESMLVAVPKSLTAQLGVSHAGGIGFKLPEGSDIEGSSHGMGRMRLSLRVLGIVERFGWADRRLSADRRAEALEAQNAILRAQLRQMQQAQRQQDGAAGPQLAGMVQKAVADALSKSQDKAWPS